MWCGCFKMHNKQQMQVFHLQNAKQHRDEPQTFWNKVIWSDETKIELFGQNHKHYIWRGFNKSCDEWYTTPTVKLGKVGQMWWWWRYECSKLSKKKIMEKNLHSSARKLCIATCEWSKTQGQVDLWLATAKWSKCSAVAISLSLNQSEETSNVQFMQDSPRIYRNWKLFTRKNGKLYHLRR